MGRRLLTAIPVLTAVLLVAVPALVLSNGCGGGDADPAALDGTSWRLVRWSEAGAGPAAFSITAAFADGKISGSSGVNTYGGAYETGPDDAFFVGDVASTMMAGPEPAMDAEQVYLTLLDAAATYRDEGGTLTLFDEFGAEALVFEVEGE